VSILAALFCSRAFFLPPPVPAAAVTNPVQLQTQAQDSGGSIAWDAKLEQSARDLEEFRAGSTEGLFLTFAVPILGGFRVLVAISVPG
jgi:hypothetical protein